VQVAVQISAENDQQTHKEQPIHVPRKVIARGMLGRVVVNHFQAKANYSESDKEQKRKATASGAATHWDADYGANRA
jgi:hypothetical protein